jgi:hypothetical protein
MSDRPYIHTAPNFQLPVIGYRIVVTDKDGNEEISGFYIAEKEAAERFADLLNEQYPDLTHTIREETA